MRAGLLCAAALSSCTALFRTYLHQSCLMHQGSHLTGREQEHSCRNGCACTGTLTEAVVRIYLKQRCLARTLPRNRAHTHLRTPLHSSRSFT